MMPAPFRVRSEAGVTTLVLDTPGAAVNVFGQAAAAQLEAVLDELEPRGAGALLLRSSKPGSFINGAGLLYARAMNSREQALAVSAPVRRVYERLAATPLFTVALIEGNCFGCGLELALCCDVRLARDLPETRFRMPELAEYRFVPLFGGTWRLPRTTGPRAAAELLLDGACWTARFALRKGLLDELLPARGLEQRVSRVLGRGAPRKAPRRTAVQRLPSRVVPPARSALWAKCARLIEAASRSSAPRARAREVEAFAQTVSAPLSKHAMSFFFVRHMARSATLGTSSQARPELQAKWLRSSRLALGPGQAEVRTGAATRPPESPIVLYFPFGRSPGAPCEVSALDPQGALERAFAGWLDWNGFHPVMTRFTPGADFVTNRLIARYLGELHRRRERGSPAPAVRRALWEAGFGQLPAELLARLGRFRAFEAACGRAALEGARGLLAAPPPGQADVGAMASVCAALTVELVRCLDQRALQHPSQGDVLLRDVLDFPLERGSLLQRVDAAGLEEVLRAAGEAGWSEGELPLGILERLRTGRGFYR